MKQVLNDDFYYMLCKLYGAWSINNTNNMFCFEVWSIYTFSATTSYEWDSRVGRKSATINEYYGTVSFVIYTDNINVDLIKDAPREEPG
jgi:hypothetical protein